MKALSIQQPWTWAILNGKPIENRTWPTRYTGPILLHAGIKFDMYGYSWLLDHRPLLTDEIPHRDQFPMGGFIGKSTIVDCVDRHESEFFFGPWGFVLRDSEPIKFIPYKGQLSIFNVPDDILKEAPRRKQKRPC